MWEKIANYKYNLKTLKFLTWTFSILLFLYGSDFFMSLIKDHTIYYKAGIFTILCLFVLLNSLYKIKTKDYKTS